MYYHGRGLPQGDTEAAKWYRMALRRLYLCGFQSIERGEEANTVGEKQSKPFQLTLNGFLEG